MVAYLKRMPAGIAGDVNRAQQVVIRPEVITPSNGTNPPVSYGVALVIDATTGQVRLPFTGDTAINGFLARPYVTNSTTNGLGVDSPPSSGACDMMMRGFMSVKLAGSTAAINGGQVYVYIAASSGAHVQGGVEAASGANLISIPGCLFSGAADANGFTEISYLP